MKKRNLWRALCSVLVLVAGGFGIVGPSYAADDDATVDALVQLNPGMTKQQVVTQADALAKQYGISRSEVLSQELEEAQASTDASGAESGAISAFSASGTAVKLTDSKNRGDIFVSPASTLFIKHGHTGIYYTTKTIVEAPGLTQKSRSIAAKDVKVAKGTVKQSVTTSQSNRDKAASYAYNNMRNKFYNANFAANHSVPADLYNCSQLVWGAYKASVKIDLDTNGGFGVYPFDLKDSKLTVTYGTL